MKLSVIKSIGEIQVNIYTTALGNKFIILPPKK